jgi:succinyl-CoA synthetase beta subunit
VNASKSLNLKIPLIVRLEGMNVEAAKKIITDSGLAIQSATDLDDAAKKAVSALK